MFDNSLISAAEFKNVEENGKVIGFQIGVRITYYRGISVALVKGFDVEVDGEKFSSEDMTFTTDDGTFPVTELQKHPDARWEFTEAAILTVNKPGGLSKGEHNVTVTSRVLVAYATPGRKPEPDLPMVFRDDPWHKNWETYRPEARATTYSRTLTIG